MLFFIVPLVLALSGKHWWHITVVTFVAMTRHDYTKKKYHFQTLCLSVSEHNVDGANGVSSMILVSTKCCLFRFSTEKGTIRCK